jgi:DNA primase
LEGYKLEFLEYRFNNSRKIDPLTVSKAVMFPISMSGRILGFGGRILTNDKRQPNI